MVTYQHNYVSLPTLRLHYLDYGGTGEVVVALHGYIQNAHFFDGIASALVPHVRLIALDLRGRGKSEWGPPADYHLRQYVEDLGYFLDRLQLSRFALMGTSLGGLVAFIYAVFHPFEVTRLVLNDVAMNSNLDEAVLVARRYSRAPSRFPGISDALAWFKEERPDRDSLDYERRVAWVSQFLCPETTGGFRFNCDPALLSLSALPRPTPRPIVQQIIMQRAAQLRIPVLLLRGATSTVTTPADAREMVQMLSDAESVDVPGIGHAPTLYEPVAQSALCRFFGITPAMG